MKTKLNILIEKDESGYAASCSEIAGYKVTAKSLDVVVKNLQATIEDYLTQVSSTKEAEESSQPIWAIAENLIADMTQEEKEQLPRDGAVQYNHYIYGTPKVD